MLFIDFVVAKDLAKLSFFHFKVPGLFLLNITLILSWYATISWSCLVTAICSEEKDYYEI